MKKTYESIGGASRNVRTSNPGKPKKGNDKPGPFDNIGRAAKSALNLGYELSGGADLERFVKNPSPGNLGDLGLSAASYAIPFAGKALQASRMAKFQRAATNSYNSLKTYENAASGAQKTMYKNLRESAEQPMVRDKMGKLTYRDNVINQKFYDSQAASKAADERVIQQAKDYKNVFKRADKMINQTDKIVKGGFAAGGALAAAKAAKEYENKKKKRDKRDER